MGDLLPLIGRFLGPERAREAFLAFAQRHGLASIDELQADAELVHYAETLLAGAIGSASARVMVASVAKEEPLGLDEVMNILDERLPRSGLILASWSKSPASWRRPPRVARRQ